MKRFFLPLISLIVVFFVAPAISHAQYSPQEIQQDYLEKAVVVSATASQTDADPWSGVKGTIQTLQVKVLNGHDAGMTATFTNNYTQVKTGDTIFVRHMSGGDAPDTWSLSDVYRIPILVGLAIIFLVAIFLFGGLPGIYAGYSAIALSIGVSSLIIIVGSYITHGFNRTTHAAVIGMIATVLITGFGAYFAVHLANLSGFTSEENAYLNFNTDGRIDMVGLLFGGIMIGLLGVLYDIAIGQAISVEELFRAGKHYTRIDVFTRGMRIGREHIGALINTLAIAYVGASLPILLLFRNQTAGIEYVVNSELFATEIIRILIGSIGLVLAVPITTFVASYMLRNVQKFTTPINESHHHHH